MSQQLRTEKQKRECFGYIQIQLKHSFETVTTFHKTVEVIAIKQLHIFPTYYHNQQFLLFFIFLNGKCLRLKNLLKKCVSK
jgi:hypothetical protein